MTSTSAVLHHRGPPQKLRGVRLSTRPDHLPSKVMSPTCTTRTTLRASSCLSVSSDAAKGGAASSETEDAATTLPAESLLMRFDAGREPKRRPVQKRRLPTDELSKYLEGVRRSAIERSSRVLSSSRFCSTKSDSLKRPQLVIDGKRKDFNKPRQQELPRRRLPNEPQFFFFMDLTENNVAGEFDERQRIYLHEFSVESAHALESQR